MKNQKSKYWLGYPDRCDLCGRQLGETFVDGATIDGSWAIMCKHCFPTNGKGLGTGKGQQYQKQPDDRWLKIKG